MKVQPIRRKTSQDREARRFDRTSLQHGHYQDIVHRDYAAHFFRWGWVGRFLANHTRARRLRVLDVGCGPRAALARVLSGSLKTYPSRYVGVDLNKVDCPRLAWAEIHERFNFLDRRARQPLGEFDVAVCLEVIEHMGTRDGRALLTAIHERLAPRGTLLLSTPVFDGFRARNHIHEYQVPELAAVLERAGFEVERRWGTFANVKALYRDLTEPERAVWERLSAYYDNDVLSLFFAPLRPDLARNNLWVCRRQP